VLVGDFLFQPSLIFEDTATALFLNEDYWSCTNIRLWLKLLSITNTLSYNTKVLITTVEIYDKNSLSKGLVLKKLLTAI
jgi:hypothetical protein